MISLDSKELLIICVDMEVSNEDIYIKSEILICLQYLPIAERFTISLHQAIIKINI